LSHQETRTKSSSYYTSFFVCKSGRKYQVPENFYFPLNEDSSLVIENSAVFQMPLSICSPSKWDQNTSSISQIDDNLIFNLVMIAWIIMSLYVLVRRKSFSDPGLDFLILSIAFYIGFILILV
jgi:hypothetical protein